MFIRQVGTRGVVITFDDQISLYLIACSRFYLLCDTHLGPDSMVQVQQLLDKEPRPDKIRIFNSHADWDHIWGNASFPGSLIIAHESCRTRMAERGHFDLEQNALMTRGMVQIRFPDCTFSDRLTFDDEGVSFSHAPGHTIDSAICYDAVDRVLFLGDLVEDPIPYLDAPDLETYLATLQTLIDHPAQIMVSAHSGLVNRDLIRSNMAYIRSFMEGVVMSPDSFGTYASVHQWNLNMHRIHSFMVGMAGGKEGQISLIDILKQAGDLHSCSSEEMQSLLLRITEI